MNAIKSVVWIVTLVALASPVFATSHMTAKSENIVESELGVKAGISPDSALYALDRATEKIQAAVSMTSEADARLHMKLAEERMAEMEAMAKVNKTEEAREARQAYESELKQAQTAASESNGEVKAEVQQRLQLHVETLEALQARFESDGVAGAIGIGTALQASQQAESSISVSAGTGVSIGTRNRTSDNATQASASSNTTTRASGTGKFTANSSASTGASYG